MFTFSSYDPENPPGRKVSLPIGEAKHMLSADIMLYLRTTPHFYAQGSTLSDINTPGGSYVTRLYYPRGTSSYPTGVEIWSYEPDPIKN